ENTNIQENIDYKICESDNKPKVLCEIRPKPKEFVNLIMNKNSGN
ncbi:28816_t:CDS:1, partial [Gigaspora margarita]